MPSACKGQKEAKFKKKQRASSSCSIHSAVHLVVHSNACPCALNLLNTFHRILYMIANNQHKKYSTNTDKSQAN